MPQNPPECTPTLLRDLGLPSRRQGKAGPQVPGQGPCSSWDERPCRVCKDHDRDRKTGPCFPIRVARCLAHGHGFTLYPPGHVPYGRKRLAPLDARDGKAWPQEGYEGSQQERFPAQMRQLRRAARLLGLAPELAGKRREEIAAVLSVPGQVIAQLCRHQASCGSNTLLGATPLRQGRT